MTESRLAAIEYAERSEWRKLKKQLREDPICARHVDEFGMLPLHWACTDRGVPRSLLSKLITLNQDALFTANKGGLLPLHIAVKAKNDLPIIKMIQRAFPTSIFAQTLTGETVLDLGKSVGLPEESMEFLRKTFEMEEENYYARHGATSQYPTKIDPDESSSSSREENNQPQRQPLRTARSMSLGKELPPRWQQEKRCNICKTKFGYLKSRHHCRNCGMSVCGAHSKKKMNLSRFGLNTPQRVCLICYDEIKNQRTRDPFANAHDDFNDIGQTSAALPHVPLKRPVPDSVEDTYIQEQVDYQPEEIIDDRAKSHSVDTPPQNRVHRSPTTDDIESGRVERMHEMRGNRTRSKKSGREESTRTRPRRGTSAEDRRPLRSKSRSIEHEVEKLERHVWNLMKDKKNMKREIMISKEEIERANRLKMETEYKIAELKQRVRNESAPVARIIDVPDDSEDGVIEKSATHHFLSLALFEKGEFQQAVVELNRSLDLYDENPQVLYDLGRIEFALDHFEEAEEALRSALDLKPTCAKSKSLLAKVLHAIGNHEAAINAYREVLDTESFSDCDEDEVGSSTVGW